MSSICCSCEIETSQLHTVCNVVSPFEVVGMYKFKKSDNISLAFEPSNQYDKNAIKVLVNSIHRSYVKKEQNQRIGYLMKRYPTYHVSKRNNFNLSADLGFGYDWDVCKQCHDQLMVTS